MDATQIDNLISMLQSPDQENHVLALATLDVQGVKCNLGMLMLCYKCGIVSEKEWRKHAPNCWSLLEPHGKKPYDGFSYQTIFEVLNGTIVKNQFLSVDMFQLFFKYFGLYLTTKCYNTNIEKIEIIVKSKENND